MREVRARRSAARLAVVVAAAGWLAACGGEVGGGAATGAAVGAQEEGTAAEAAAGGGEEAGRSYVVRIDDGRSDPGDFLLARGEEALVIRTGPAGIAYRPMDVVERGDFRVDATFQQRGAPVGYREAYGVFVGGRDLEGPDQEYTYFLIRGTGEFLIKRRVGETTEVLVDWTPHEAVRGVTQPGEEPTNTLTVEVADGQVNFIVNGRLAHTMPAAEARPWGVAGLRVNHRLDLRVVEWGVG